VPTSVDPQFVAENKYTDFHIAYIIVSNVVVVAISNQAYARMGKWPILPVEILAVCIDKIIAK
jgi:hypothetical protein